MRLGANLAQFTMHVELPHSNMCTCRNLSSTETLIKLLTKKIADGISQVTLIFCYPRPLFPVNKHDCLVLFFPTFPYHCTYV